MHNPHWAPGCSDAGSLPLGPRPGAPYDFKVKRVKDGFIMSWEPPKDSPVPVQYYDIEYKVENGWKKMNKEQIVGETSWKGIIKFYTWLYTPS